MDNDNFTCGIVALCGRPNVGKSTLLNLLTGMTLAITTYKPQTTRDLIRGVYNTENSQFIFLDTPGLFKANTSLDHVMQKRAYVAMSEADCLVLIIDANYKPYVGEQESRVLALARREQKPVILLINKIDTVKKEAVLPLIAAFSASFDFAAIIPVSARKNDGIADFLAELQKVLPQQPPLLDVTDETNQTEKTLAAEYIRREVLLHCDKEVPHGVAVVIEEFKEEETESKRHIDISAVIVCERDSHKSIILGHGGEMIKKIGTAARSELMQAFEARVHLDLFVKVKKNWKRRPQDLKSFGLDERRVELS